jgi:hypothetical protein
MKSPSGIWERDTKAFLGAYDGKVTNFFGKSSGPRVTYEPPVGGVTISPQWPPVVAGSADATIAVPSHHCPLIIQ